MCTQYHFIHEKAVVLLGRPKHLERVRQERANDAAYGTSSEVAARLEVIRKPALNLRIKEKGKLHTKEAKRQY